MSPIPVDLPTRLIQRGGVALPSRSELHIYRQPPSSVMTRKKERVNEGDIQWMVRPDAPGSAPDRFNESIKFFASGVNPSVSVNYSQLGAGGSKTLYLPQNQSGSVYKLDVVRPPLLPPESLLPLSRPRIHQTKAVETNPGLGLGLAGNTLAYDYDKYASDQAIITEISGGPTVTATATYKLEQPQVMSARYAISDIKSGYEINSNPQLPANYQMNADSSGKVRADTILKNIRPNFSIIIYDPSTHISTEVSANIKQKDYIAMQAAVGAPIELNQQDGSTIQLRDYRWTTVNSAIGSDQVVLTVNQPDIQLDRNAPLYASSSGLNIPNNTTELTNPDITLYGKVHADAITNLKLSHLYGDDQVRLLQSKTQTHQPLSLPAYENSATYLPQYIDREQPQIRIRDMNRVKQAHQQAYGHHFY